jgi:aspartate dehydrogenase
MSMVTSHVGLIGYGTVAQGVVRLLLAQPLPPRITLLLREGSASRAVVPESVGVVSDLQSLLADQPDLILEAAGQRPATELVPAVLAAGVPALVVSTGVFAEAGLLDRFEAIAAAGGSRLLLSAGAVGGLDYLDAVALGHDLRVRYTSRKPPGAWHAELAALGQDAATLATEIVLFEGSAEDAARLYPLNLNVALTLRLRLGRKASITVRVTADPQVRHNTHEVEVESNLGTALMRFANWPSVINPKTSALTGYTVAAETLHALRVLLR